jgi:uncharacterized protein YdcH (DUF465 family)
MKDAVATRKDIDDVLHVVKGFVQQSSEQFAEVIDRLDKADSRFDKFAFSVNDRFDKIEDRITDLEKTHNRIANTIGRFLARIDSYETEQTARDSQFNKLLKWARKVSKQTGIPIEGL